MDFIPVAIFWAIAVRGMTSKRPILIYLFFCSMPFGSFAAIPPAITGSLTFVPTPVVGMLIVLRYVGNVAAIERVLSLAVKPSRFLLLTLFWLAALVTTIFMPRLFAGSVMIIPMRAELLIATHLQPTAQNISQLAYLTISVLTAFAFTQVLRTQSSRQDVLKAIVWGSVLAILSGFADFFSQYVPLQAVLDPFRTATYSLLVSAEALGGKRVVGLMPEASAFGALCMTFLATLYFFRRAMLDPFLRDRVTPVLMALLLLLCYLSTSSAAYVSLAVLFCAAAGEWCWRAVSSRTNRLRSRGLATEFWIAFSLLSIICVVILFLPTLLDPVVEAVNNLVFEKASTSSFEERGMWTAVSWQALIDTYGLGVGMGATRASNGVVAVISNTGVISSLFYFSFLLQTYFRKAPKNDEAGAAIISGFRWSYLPSFVITVLTGTGADFGCFNGFLYAIVMAIALPASVGNTRREPMGAARFYHSV